MDTPDDDLILAYRSGDEAALKTLIDRYVDPIYAFARRMTGSNADAEDVAQETFVKAWRTLDRYKLTGTFKAWIFAIARNTAIDKLRKKKVPVFTDFEDATGKNPFVESLSDPETLPETLIAKAEEKGLLDAGLLSLSPPDREILLLHYSEELTFEEIGRMLKKPPNTVKSRHRRALQKLRDFFEKSP